jgi:6-phosphogluconolactonase
VFVGTSTGDADDGVYTFLFDHTSGSLEAENAFTGLARPSFLAISDDGAFVYAVHAMEGEADGVSAFRVDRATGSLTLLNQVSSGGRGACYVAVNSTRTWVVVANYGTGNVVSIPVQRDGSLGPPAGYSQHLGSGPDSTRQEGPHAHYIDWDPQERFLFAADLGADKVFVYTLDAETGMIDSIRPRWLEIAPGDGPRHVDFAPNGRFLYVVNELAGSVSAFRYGDDMERATQIQTITTLPTGFDGYNKSADIHVHPSGKFVYASNRGDFDSIVVFAVDQETGELSHVEYVTESIAWPRNFEIDPSGRYLLVANANARNIATFHIDQETGTLTPTGHSVDVPKPMFVGF